MFLFNTDIFVKKDSRPTWQSDTARIDIVPTTGNLNITGFTQSQPAWLKKGESQGSTLSFAYGVRNTHYKIRIVPNFKNETGDLTLRFMGKYVKEKNKVVPAFAQYKGVLLNGTNILNKAKVWHNEPYAYTLKNIKNGEVLNLEFDVRKPLKASDFMLYKLALIFTLLALFGIAWSKLNLTQKLTKSKFNATDLPRLLYQRYKSIDELYRHTFWVLFVANAIVFGYITIHFLWGNHDWGFIINGVATHTQTFQGRYAAHILGSLLLGGKILPFANHLLGFVGLAFSAILACIYLKLTRSKANFILVGLLITLCPLTLTRFYYLFEVPNFYIISALTISGLILSEKLYTLNLTTPKKLALVVLSIFLIHLSMAGYSAMIVLIAVLLCGRLLVESLHYDGTNFKACFFKFKFSIFCSFAAVVLYKLICVVLKKAGIVKDFYNNQQFPLSEMPYHVVKSVKWAFQTLFNYDFAFHPNFITLCFTGLLAVWFVFFVTSKRAFRAKILTLFLLFCLIASTQLPNMIASNAVTPRIDVFSLPYFRAIIVILVLGLNLNFVRNATFVAGSVLVWVCSLNSLEWQKVLEFEHNTWRMEVNSVLTRIENNKEFKKGNGYDFVMLSVSNTPFDRFKSNLQLPYKSDGSGLTTYKYPIDSGFNPLISAWFYANDRVKFKHRINLRNAEKATQIATRLKKAGILDKIKVGEVVVFEDIIVWSKEKSQLDQFKNLAKK